MKIIFAGTPDFSIPPLQMLIDSEHTLVAVYSQPDRPAGRGRQLKPSPVKALAQANAIPVLQPRTLRDPEAIEQMAALQADLMVVVAYGLLLPQEVLDLPRLGCLNIHASLLPRWRGAAPIQRAVMAGDAVTGITLMQIERKLDAGPMYQRAETAILPGETASELHDRLSLLGAETLRTLLPAIEDGSAIAEQQDESLVTYAAKLEKSESQLAWSHSAVELEQQVRALNCWPVAQTQLDGKVLRIWHAEALDRPTDAAPGTVVKAESGQLEVATGDGLLRLLEVQQPGKKRQPVAAFLNAHRLNDVRLGLP